MVTTQIFLRYSLFLILPSFCGFVLMSLIGQVVRMISLAWERVRKETIVNGWRASGLGRAAGVAAEGGVGNAVPAAPPADELEEEVEGIEFVDEEDDEINEM